MFRAFACLVIGRLCERSIIALRSADRLCRALLPKNRSPASALRSWHAATSRRRLVAPPRCHRDRKHRQPRPRSEEHTSELQSHVNLVCRLLLEKKKKIEYTSLIVKKKKKQ